MSFTGFALMCLFSIIGVKYLVDMIKYSMGYEINGKCRYGRKYARELAKGRKPGKVKKNKTLPVQRDVEIHNEITKLIAQLGVN